MVMGYEKRGCRAKPMDALSKETVERTGVVKPGFDYWPENTRA